MATASLYHHVISISFWLFNNGWPSPFEYIFKKWDTWHFELHRLRPFNKWLDFFILVRYIAYIDLFSKRQRDSHWTTLYYERFMLTCTRPPLSSFRESEMSFNFLIRDSRVCAAASLIHIYVRNDGGRQPAYSIKFDKYEKFWRYNFQQNCLHSAAITISTAFIDSII